MEYLIIIWLMLIGAILGSFLGCMGYRIPNKIKTTYPSSFCSSCKKPLKWYMNIPIISYVYQGGKCSYCKEKIGFIYFLCEVIGALMLPINYVVFGFELEFFVSSILTCALIVTIVSDFKYYYISDRVLIISGVLIIIVQLCFKDQTDIVMNLCSAVLLFIIMYVIKLLGNAMFKKESLGDGDIKLMALIALSVGWLNSFVTLFIGALTALIYSLITMKKNKEGIVPFGPFLLLGSIAVIYLQDIITPLIMKYLVI